MTSIAFDTLKFARKLQEAGFPPEQAAKTSEALAEAMTGAELATKSDLRELELRLVIKLGAMVFALGGLMIALKIFHS